MRKSKGFHWLKVLFAKEKLAVACSTIAILLVGSGRRFVTFIASIHNSKVEVKFIAVKPEVEPVSNEMHLLKATIVAVTAAVTVDIRRPYGFQCIYLNS